MNRKDLKVGSYYTIPEDVVNKHGTRRQGPVHLLEARIFPKGLRLRCFSQVEVRRDLGLDESGADATTPFGFSVCKKMNVDWRRSANGTAQSIQTLPGRDRIYIYLLPGVSTSNRGMRALELLIASLVEMPLDNAELFRVAGVPFDERNDGAFESVYAWAARRGLLSLAQVQAWRSAREQEEKE